MSIEKDTYTSKKTGKTRTTYYAVVWHPDENRKIWGEARSTEKQAKQDETDIQRAIAAGKAKPEGKKRKLKVDEVYEEWHKATVPPIYSNNTWQIYGRFYKDYIKDVFGSRNAYDIAPMHVQKYVNLMAQKYAPETVNKCLNILIDIFNFAVDVLKCITVNPAAGIKRCKVPVKKKVTWSDEQVAYFLALPQVRESHYYPMLVISAALGARPGEVCGLREDCLQSDPCYTIDFERGYDNYECETDLKTNGSHRTPPIPKYLYKILHRRLLWKKEVRLVDKSWGDNNYLFVSQNGQPIKPRQYARAFKRLLLAHNAEVEKYTEEYGEAPEEVQALPEISLYGFRTSFATNNMRRTPNAALISSIMGNSPKTLLQFYTMSDLDMQAQLVNNYIKPERTIS